MAARRRAQAECLFVFAVFIATFSRSTCDHVYPLPWLSNKAPDLDMDTAWIHITEGSNDATQLSTSHSKGKMALFYASYDICDRCALKFVGNQTLNKTWVVASSQYSLQLQIKDSNGATICTIQKHLAEYGQYQLYLNPSKGERCNFYSLNNPPDSNIPIYVALAIFVVMALLAMLLIYLHRKQYLYRILFCFENERLINTDLGSPSPVDGSGKIETGQDPQPSSSPPKSRLRSLDTMRGLSLIIMIFVNYGGGRYWFFAHSRWNGITLADTVFPWFVFIMGTSISLAFKGLLRRNTPKLQMVFKVVKRTVILFCLGLFLNSMKGPIQLTQLRIPGVLQRLGFTYFLVAILEVFFAQPPNKFEHHKYLSPARDIVSYWPEWIVMTIFVTLHTCLTFLMKFESCPRGYLGPGGLHNNGSQFHCTGGAAGYIDRQFFGVNHIYSHPTPLDWYFPAGTENVYYDPEGILGTLNSAFLCFLGLQAGKILNMYNDWVQRVIRWSIWCVLTGVIATILCKATRDDGWVPINKNLWSISFILCLASMAFFLFVLCYLLIDVYKLWSGAPFIYPGMNSILIYLGHEILNPYFPIQWEVPSRHWDTLAMHLWGAGFWLIVSYILFRKNIFLAI